MGTKASWETAASFFSVRQEIGDIHYVHYMEKPPLLRPSTTNLHHWPYQYLLRLFPLPLPLNVTTDSTRWHMVSVYLPFRPNLRIARLCHFLARRPRQYVAP